MNKLPRFSPPRPSMILLALVVGLAGAAALHAHLKVKKTLPEHDTRLGEPPQVLQVWFTQEPDMVFSRLSLAGPDGAVALGKVTTTGAKDLRAVVEGDLPPGAYTASWQTAGDDGHIQKGEWSFHFGTDDPAP